MPRIRCHYIDCVFLDDGYCSSSAIELDSDVGCMTYSRTTDIEREVGWDEDEKDLGDWDEIDSDDDLWLDDDDI